MTRHASARLVGFEPSFPRRTGSSYPLMYVIPPKAAPLIACSLASPMCAPCTITLAPSARHLSTLASGATVGITTVTGTARLAPW